MDLEYDSTDPEEVNFMTEELQQEIFEETDAVEDRLIQKRTIKEVTKVREDMER